MDQSIGREHIPIRNREWLPFESRGFAPCFFHYQNSSRGIPCVQVELPESVKAAASNVREIERRRSGTPHAVRPKRQLVIEENIGILVTLVTGESGRDQRLRQLVGLRDFDLLTVQESTFSEFRGKQINPRGII